MCPCIWGVPPPSLSQKKHTNPFEPQSPALVSCQIIIIRYHSGTGTCRSTSDNTETIRSRPQSKPCVAEQILRNTLAHNYYNYRVAFHFRIYIYHVHRKGTLQDSHCLLLSVQSTLDDHAPSFTWRIHIYMLHVTKMLIFFPFIF